MTGRVNEKVEPRPLGLDDAEGEPTLRGDFNTAKTAPMILALERWRAMMPNNRFEGAARREWSLGAGVDAFAFALL